MQQSAESERSQLERQLAETRSQLSALQKKRDEEKLLGNEKKQATSSANQMSPQQALHLAAAYKSLCKKAELEEALHQQELCKKEAEVKDLLSQVQKQTEVARQQEAENKSLRLRLQAAATQQQQQAEQGGRGATTDGSSGANLSSVRENEDLRRQLQDAKQEMTRQQQKVRTAVRGLACERKRTPVSCQVPCKESVRSCRARTTRADCEVLGVRAPEGFLWCRSTCRTEDIVSCGGRVCAVAVGHQERTQEEQHRAAKLEDSTCTSSDNWRCS